MAFLHGVEIVEIDTGPRPIQTVKSSVIGIVGTAPEAGVSKPASVMVNDDKPQTTLEVISEEPGTSGNGTRIVLRHPHTPNAPIKISEQGNSVIVSLGTEANSQIYSTATDVRSALNTYSTLVKAGQAGLYAAGVEPTEKETSADHPGRVPMREQTATLTGGSSGTFPLNTPVLIAGSQREAAALGTAGTLPPAMNAIFDQVGAMVVVIRVEEGADDAATLSNVIGGVGDDGQYKGIDALLGAECALGVSPKILIAPGFSHNEAVATACQPVADRLRATAIIEGPDTNDAAAIAYRDSFGSKRLFMVDPGMKAWSTPQDQEITVSNSAYVAGLMARIDNERGFWWSPSNQPIYGITGLTRPIDFVLGDVNSRANYLNENEVTTVIQQDGYRLWGNRTCSSDPKWAFINVVRTADILNDSLQREHLWAVDRCITKTYVSDVQEGVNAYIRTLIAQGALLGGHCWPDPDLNSPTNLAAGKVYWNFDFTPPAPAEHLTFQSILTNSYYNTLAEAA